MIGGGRHDPIVNVYMRTRAYRALPETTARGCFPIGWENKSQADSRIREKKTNPGAHVCVGPVPYPPIGWRVGGNAEPSHLGHADR